MKTENVAKKYALNLFEYTYWSSSPAPAKMQENRIRFAEEYDLAEVIKGKFYIDVEAISRKLFDHVEIYKVRSKEQYLVLVSPYDAKSGLEVIASELGFNPIYPVYMPNAKSFIRIFDSYGDMKSFLNPNKKYLD